MAGKSKRARRAAPPESKLAKRNLLKTLGVTAVDYKDTARLRTFKNSREMALLPYPGTTSG
jgi:small subunit ribosomal protein S18